MMNQTSRKRKSSSIDMSSLMDIIFILLIFVMMSISFTKTYNEIKIDVPKSEIGNSSLDEEIKISMNEKDEIFLENKRINLDELKRNSTLKILENKKVKLFIHKNNSYQSFILILGIIKSAKIKSLNLATE